MFKMWPQVVVVIAWAAVLVTVSGQDSCRVDLVSDRNDSSSHVGTIRSSDADILTAGRCEWVVDPAPGRVLLARVESLNLARRPTFLGLVVDGNVTNITNSCVECLPDFFGASLRVIWDESESPGVGETRSVKPTGPFAPVPGARDPSSNDSCSFSIRFAVFDTDRCHVPDDLDNAYVDGRPSTGSVGVGGSVRYRCLPSHSVADGSQAGDADCVVSFDQPAAPSWSKPPPVCRRTHCGEYPAVVHLDDSRPQLVSFSSDSVSEQSCIWEVVSTAEGSSVRLALERFGVDARGQSLELYDGEVRDDRLLARLADGVDEFRNFTGLHGSLVAVFGAGGHRLEPSNGTLRFRARFSVEALPCPVPKPSENGDFRGAEVEDRRSSSAVAIAVFTCADGYVLVGSDRAACRDDGAWSSPAPSCEGISIADGGDDVAGPYFKEEKGVGKVPQLRPDKLSRPHPQSTEEKNGRKQGGGGGRESPGAKSLPGTAATNASLPVLSDDDLPYSGDPEPSWRIGGDGELDYVDVMSGASDLGGYANEDGDDDILEDEETVSDRESELTGFPMLAIVLGVTLPLLICTVVLVSCVVYRRLYPVRMGPGRKFETFENPIYDRNRRAPASSSAAPASLLLSHGPAQNLGELERLTTHASP